jgi:F420-non-reducing hydrogenase iron-sulfur subunit
MGIDAQRIAIEWSSSAEAPRFAHLVTAFTQRIRALGPNPLRNAARAGAV